MKLHLRTLAPVAALFFGVACTDAPPAAAPRDATAFTDASDAAPDLPAVVDAGSDAPTDAGPASRLAPGPYGVRPRDLAGPFTVMTQDGPWSFAEHFSPDDSYLFIVASTGSYSTQLLSGSLGDTLAASPRNVHFFILNGGGTATFTGFQQRTMDDLAGFSDEDRTWWTPRVHFVQDPLTGQQNWLGDLFRARRNTTNMVPRYEAVQWAVDRAQRIREVGQLGRIAGGGTLQLDLTYLSHEAQYYNFEADRERDLRARPATTVTLLDNATVTDTQDVDVVLPSGAELDGYDTLEVDLAMNCVNHRDGDCGAWDYLSYLWICDPAAPLADGGANYACNNEIARWITSYWREGRWVTDITGMLPLLRGGGRQHLRWNASRQWDPRPAPYVVSLSLRFSNQGRPVRPVETRPLYTGGALNDGWTTRHPATHFSVPPGIRKVELYSLVTGHGSATSQCAEFCNHGHHFALNGHPHVIDFPGAQTLEGCANRVGEGVVPNQDGTWYFGRGGWCPGFDVRPVVWDVTSELRTDVDNELAYTVTVNNNPLRAGAGYGDIVLSQYLVLSR